MCAEKGTPTAATITRVEIPATPPTTTRKFQRVAEDLADRGVSVAKMFGMPSLRAGGKAFAGVYGDAMVFKLGGEAHAAALGLKGAQLFDPSGMGRAMKEWVFVPPAHAKRWAGLAEQARVYVTGA